MNIASYSLSVNVHCSVLIIFIALWTGGHVSTSVFWFAFTIWHIPCLYLKLKYLIETIDAVSSTMSFCKGINNNSINNQWGLSQFIRVAVALFRGMMPCRPNASFLVRMSKGECGRRDLCLSWPRLVKRGRCVLLDLRNTGLNIWRKSSVVSIAPFVHIRLSRSTVIVHNNLGNYLHNTDVFYQTW